MIERFLSLCRDLISKDLLSEDYTVTTTAIQQMDYVEPNSVRVFWREGGDQIKKAEAEEIIANWPWESDRDPLEDTVMIPETKALFVSTDPLANMMRVFGRHCWDRMNEIAEFVGMPKKQEPAIFGEIEAYIDAKLHLPGLRPDLEAPTDGG